MVIFVAHSLWQKIGYDLLEALIGLGLVGGVMVAFALCMSKLD